MATPSVQVEQIIESVLRGAAKMVGCHSASLIAFNEKTRKVSIRVGVTAGDMKEDLTRVEAVLGDVKSAVFDFDDVKDSKIFEAWKERKVFESGSIAALVGTAIEPTVVSSMDEIIGLHRFICVPAVGSQGRCHGVVLFEQPGPRPFNPQQRELLIAYARRIGAILEDGAQAWRPSEVLARYLLDREGRVVGSTFGHEQFEITSEVARRAIAVLDGGDGGPVWIDPGPLVPHGAEVVRMRLRGEDLALVTLHGTGARSGAAGRQLLELAMSESAPAVLVDPGLTVTSCNEAAAELFGFGPHELVGQPISTLLRDPKEAKVILNHQLLCLSSGYYEETTVLRRKDGTFFPGRIETLLLADDSSRVVGFLVLVRSDAAVGGKGAEDVERLMRQERLASLGQMAAQLAHEVRNPLVAIGATLDSLASSMPEGSEAKDVLAALHGEITRLDMTLRDYLSMAARHRMTVAAVELRAAMEEARRLLDATRRRTGVTVECKIQGGLVVLGDPDALRQVFFNLMLNALDAMPDGGKIVCSATRGPDAVTIHVDDSGVGLSVAPERCFEPFFTTKEFGTGLGLTVCRQLIEAHGGAITLKNRRKGGCRASVVLPLKRR